MAMFGSKSPAAAAKYDPSQLSRGDRMMLFGAMMRDVGGGLRGEPTDALLNAQALLAGRQQQAQKAALLGEIGDMMGGQPQSTIDQVNAPQVGLNPAPAATSAPVPLSDPRWAKLALMAPQVGLDLNPMLKLQEMNKPEYVNGLRVNPYAPDAPSYVPTLDKGQAPDIRGGQVVGVHNLPGAVSAAADMAGAVSGATEAGKAGWDLVDVPMSDGSTVKLPRAVAVPLLAKNAGRFGVGGGQPAAGGPTLGVTQSPAAQAADVDTAKAGVAANVQLPQQLADAQQARDLISIIKQNPAGKNRTGLMSMLPAIPGSPGAAFDAEDAQLRGKLFMQAYNGLRGGGQITEVEGKKATEAMARLSRAQSWEDYNKALDDLDAVLVAGMERARQQPARLQPSQGARPLAGVPLQDRLAEARRRGLIK